VILSLELGVAQSGPCLDENAPDNPFSKVEWGYRREWPNGRRKEDSQMCVALRSCTPYALATAVVSETITATSPWKAKEIWPQLLIDRLVLASSVEA
jgi:hypothetical protein